MKKTLLRIGLGVGLCMFFAPVSATQQLADVDLTANPDILRGASNLIRWCNSCHSFAPLKYKDLQLLNVPQQAIDLLRAERKLDDPISPRSDPEGVKIVFGKTPPNLVELVRSREDGPAYVYTWLTSFYADEKGKIKNRLKPDTTMPDILAYSADSSPERQAQLQTLARDIASFLAWTRDLRPLPQ